jgi:hypothetical protein
VRGEDRDDASFLEAVLGDGRPLLLATAAALFFSGGLALFLAASRDLLPQDVRYLGMTAAELCQVRSCRILDFMVHDRAAFGGALLGLGVLYTWLTVFPLSRHEQWAWWTWLVTGGAGFMTFLAYLGYGYLDTWHGMGTLLLLPVFVTGMWRSRRLVGPIQLAGALRGDERATRLAGRQEWGRIVLLGGAAATAIGGLAILRIGVTDTFVPEDLDFIGLTAADLRAINPRLVSLIAHDRAGFGGAVFTLGLTTLLCLWCARPSRHLRQAVATAGVLSLSAALGVHMTVGYTDWWHLVPPVVAAVLLLIGLSLWRSPQT